MRRLEVLSPEGVPEVRAGDDLAALLLAALGDDETLRDGDIVVVTSKVVSKAEDRLVAGDRETALPGETRRVVAQRSATTIVRNRLGLTMAAAGIDASNVPRGQVALLPLDPDASARGLRERLTAATGARLAVVVTDTAGRAWRHGQHDIAIGAAGLVVADDHAGRLDPHGNPLVVTLPAVADEVAGAAELAGGKLSGRPYAVVRGRADLVLPDGDHGAGAASLVRPEGEDLFGFGAREAVVRALAGAPGDRAPFGAPADLADLASALSRVVGRVESRVEGRVRSRADHAGPDGERAATLRLPRSAPAPVVAAICFAHGWEVIGDLDPTQGAVLARVRPTTP